MRQAACRAPPARQWHTAGQAIARRARTRLHPAARGCAWPRCARRADAPARFRPPQIRSAHRARAAGRYRHHADGRNGTPGRSRPPWRIAGRPGPAARNPRRSSPTGGRRNGSCPRCRHRSRAALRSWRGPGSAGAAARPGRKFARQRLEAHRHRRHAQRARARLRAAPMPDAPGAGHQRRRCRPRFRAGTASRPRRL